MLTGRLAHAKSHMKATPSLWRDRLAQEKTVPNMRTGSMGDTTQVSSTDFTYYPRRKIMIFRGNLTRNFYPASLG